MNGLSVTHSDAPVYSHGWNGLSLIYRIILDCPLPIHLMRMLQWVSLDDSFDENVASFFDELRIAHAWWSSSDKWYRASSCCLAIVRACSRSFGSGCELGMTSEGGWHSPGNPFQLNQFADPNKQTRWPTKAMPHAQQHAASQHISQSFASPLSFSRHLEQAAFQLPLTPMAAFLERNETDRMAHSNRHISMDDKVRSFTTVFHDLFCM